MATTMNLIAKQTVGSGGAASVTFSNIPQTFTDLKVVISGRGTTSGTSESIRILPNGSSSSLTYLQLQGTGSAAFSGTGTYWYLGEMPAATATSSTFGSAEVYIPNYTSANNKSASSDNAHENNTSTAYLNLNALLWSNTAAITSLVIQPNSNNFVEFSEFYLYGISSSSTQNTSVPLASGGDVITTDGTYWYHTFLYSGTFTPLKNLTCDLLVVAGGGGGGASRGGANSQNPSSGGAGGGFLSGSMALTASNVYTTLVGAGGSGGVGSGVNGAQGSNSVFNGATANGGGAGVSGNEVIGIAGGSGSGGSGTQVGGSATQGNSGGLTGFGFGGGAGGGTVAGGSGGAGGAGANGSSGSNNGTNGGLAKTYVSYNGTQSYAGGGGGGAYWINSGQTGGTGGTNAGNGATGQSGAQTGTNAIANFGGGGGGAGTISGAVATGSGGSGGSGIIIVRYPV